MKVEASSAASFSRSTVPVPVPPPIGVRELKPSVEAEKPLSSTVRFGLMY